MPVNFLTKRKQKDFLKNVQYKDVPYFNLIGYNTWAKCVKVVDGDTAIFVFYYHKVPYRFRVRLAKINCAEMKSEDPAELSVAILAKDYLTSLIGDELIYIECLNYEPAYGRLMANLYSNKKMEKSFSDALLEKGLAHLYTKKKVAFTDWYKN